MKRWISDDGRVEVTHRDSQLTATVPALDSGRFTARLHPRHDASRRAWIGWAYDGDDRHAITVVQDGAELVVRHSWMRPWAAGGEADPRRDSAEWRCARVIEERTA